MLPLTDKWGCKLLSTASSLLLRVTERWRRGATRLELFLSVMLTSQSHFWSKDTNNKMIEIEIELKLTGFLADCFIDQLRQLV